MRSALLLIALMGMPLGAAAQDPVKVDHKHYKVLLDNKQVRVLKITYGAHEKSVMHEHPEAVAVFIDDANAKFTLADGTSRPETHKAGDIELTPAGKHLPENVGDAPFEVVLVELKGAPAVPHDAELDAVKIDPEHHTVVLENDRVRVLRISLAANDKTKDHEHPNSVAVYTSDAVSTVTLGNGKTRKGGGQRGTVRWLPGERHEVENSGAQPSEVILVELK